MTSTLSHNPVSFSKTKSEFYATEFFKQLEYDILTKSPSSESDMKRVTPIVFISIVAGVLLGPPIAGTNIIKSSYLNNKLIDNSSIKTSGNESTSPFKSDISTSDVAWKEMVSDDEDTDDPVTSHTTVSHINSIVKSPEDLKYLQSLAMTTESLRSQLSSSHKQIISYLNGANRGMIPNLYLNIADVRLALMSELS